jgi:hypothetical protein
MSVIDRNWTVIESTKELQIYGIGVVNTSAGIKTKYLSVSTC